MCEGTFVINDIFLIKRPGEPVYWRSLSKEKSSLSLDVTLVAGVLQAVNTFSEEVFNENISRIIFDDYNILVYQVVDDYISVFLIDRDDVDSIPKAADIATEICLALKTNNPTDKEEIVAIVNKIIESKYTLAPSKTKLKDLLKSIREFHSYLESIEKLEVSNPLADEDLL